ncbi:MAG TPA: hypothetical protein VNI84_21000 [Pyrinomonadaceae bacterium]|nr:hypothetical protein [Pyrinomonadaceae bacterium]
MKANKARKSYVRPFLMGAAIFTVLVLHFAVSQFIAVESVKDSAVNESITKPPVAAEPQTEAKKPEAKTVTEAAFPPVKPEPKVEVEREVEKETVNKKKAPRESRAERLRRTEKILTGI